MCCSGSVQICMMYVQYTLIVYEFLMNFAIKYVVSRRNIFAMFKAMYAHIILELHCLHEEALADFSVDLAVCSIPYFLNDQAAIFQAFLLL